jgi:hypothetical protein
MHLHHDHDHQRRHDDGDASNHHAEGDWPIDADEGRTSHFETWFLSAGQAIVRKLLHSEARG